MVSPPVSGFGHAVEQGDKHTDGAEQPGDRVGDGIADMHWRPVGGAANRREAGIGLSDPREARTLRQRPGLAVAGNPEHDQVGIQFLQHVRSQAVALQRAGPEVLGQYVDLGDQLPEQILAFVLAQIEGNALLVAVGDLPPKRHAVLVRRQGSQGVADPRQFHLDHLGAEIGKQAAGHGCGDYRGNIENAHALEGHSRVFGHDVIPSRSIDAAARSRSARFLFRSGC